jgi:hypothetical protein
MRFKVIACKALFREISMLAANTDAVLDVTYLRQGLHDTPDLLRDALQKEIDAVDEGCDVHTNEARYGRQFDAILLGYGLCSNGVAGVSSSKHKLVVPRTDDCIGIFLGSYAKYRAYFDAHPGTYWYNASWIENAYTPSEQNRKALLEEYTEKYGEDNAEYLVDAQNTTRNYTNAAYVAWEGLDFPEYERYSREAAAFFGWNFDLVKGDPGWLSDLLSGRHDDRFAVARPGEMLAQDFGGRVIRACPRFKEAQ